MNLEPPQYLIHTIVQMVQRCKETITTLRHIRRPRPERIGNHPEKGWPLPPPFPHSRLVSSSIPAFPPRHARPASPVSLTPVVTHYTVGLSTQKLSSLVSRRAWAPHMFLVYSSVQSQPCSRAAISICRFVTRIHAVENESRSLFFFMP